MVSPSQLGHHFQYIMVPEFPEIYVLSIEYSGNISSHPALRIHEHRKLPYFEEDHQST